METLSLILKLVFSIGFELQRNRGGWKLSFHAGIQEQVRTGGTWIASINKIQKTSTARSRIHSSYLTFRKQDSQAVLLKTHCTDLPITFQAAHLLSKPPSWAFPSPDFVPRLPFPLLQTLCLQPETVGKVRKKLLCAFANVSWVVWRDASNSRPARVLLPADTSWPPRAVHKSSSC